MLIDWFTVGAQVLNFLVLVVVLKLLLFDRVVVAMDAREERIAGRIREAEAREEEAEAEAEAHRAQQRRLNKEREDRLQQAEADAAARSAELLEHAREHVEAQRAGWQQALRRDQAHLLDEVRRRTAEQVCHVSRQALADLATADLERQVVQVAVDRMQCDERLQPLLEQRGENARAVSVRTSFELPDDLAALVTKTVARRVGCPEDDVSVSRDPELVCGLEVRIGAWAVGWNVDRYLDTVIEEVGALLPAGDDAESGRTPAHDGQRP